MNRIAGNDIILSNFAAVGMSLSISLFLPNLWERSFSLPDLEYIQSVTSEDYVIILINIDTSQHILRELLDDRTDVEDDRNISNDARSQDMSEEK